MTTALARTSKVRATCHPGRYAADEAGNCRWCAQEKRTHAVVEADAKSLTKAARAARHQELLELHKQVEYVEGLGKTARAILQANLPEYAELHLQAAQEAAIKGDARPAEWALSQVKAGKEGQTVEPAAKTPSDSGVKVYVGINMGGIAAQSVPAIEVRGTPDGPPDV